MTKIASEDVLRFVRFECMSSYEDFLIDVRAGIRSLRSRVDMLILNGGVEGWKGDYTIGSVTVSKGSGGLIEFTVPPVMSERGVCAMALDAVPAFLSEMRKRVERFMFRRFSVIERMFLRRLMNIDVRTPVGEGRSYWMITDADREAFRKIRSHVRNMSYGGFSVGLGDTTIPVPSRKGVSLVISVSDAADFSRAEDRDGAARMMNQASRARTQAEELLRAIRLSEDTTHSPSPIPPVPPVPPIPTPPETAADAASDRAVPGAEAAYADAGVSAAPAPSSSLFPSPSSSSSSSSTTAELSPELSPSAPAYQFDGSTISVRESPGCTVEVRRDGGDLSMADDLASSQYRVYGNPSRMFEFRRMDAVKLSLVRDTSMRIESRPLRDGTQFVASLDPSELSGFHDADAGVSSVAATATTCLREVLDVAVFDREVFDDVVDAAAKYMTR